jgi:hypothetical protein
VAALHAAVEELSALKELRTPLLLRATARNNVVLVAPILTGSALAELARSAPGSAAFAWSVAVGCMVRRGGAAPLPGQRAVRGAARAWGRACTRACATGS